MRSRDTGLERAMARALRVTAWAAAVVILLLVVALVVLHLPPVQQAIASRVLARIAATGWQVEAERVRFRAFPARLEAWGVRVAAQDGPPLARAEHLRAEWRWRGVLGVPRRLELVRVVDLWVDLAALPEREEPPPPPEGGPLDFLDAFEIGVIDLAGSEVSLGVPGVGLRFAGISVDGAAEGGRARIELSVASVAATREGRPLELGAVELELAASRRGVSVQRARIDGERLRAELEGSYSVAEQEPVLEGRFSLEASLPELITWWDPELQRQLAAEGWLSLAGRARYETDEGLLLAADGAGTGVVVAGYPIAQLRLTTPGGKPLIEAADPSWGRIAAGPLEDDRVPFSAALEQAPLAGVRAMLPAEAAAQIPPGAVATGTLEGVIPLPFDAERLSAAADVRIVAPESSLAVVGSLRGRLVRLDSVRASLRGGWLEGDGVLELERRVSVRARLRADAPGPFSDALRRFAPLPEGLRLEGGPIVIDARAEGAWQTPAIDLVLDWRSPFGAGGGLEASGRLVPQRSVDARAELVVEQPALVAAALRRAGWLPAELEIHGGPLRLEAGAVGAWQTPALRARLSWVDPLVAGRHLDLLEAGAEGPFDDLAWTLDARAGEGSLSASGRAAPAARRVSGELRIASMPAPLVGLLADPEAPLPLAGTIAGSGSFSLDGERWEVAADLGWEDPAWEGWRANALELRASAHEDHLIIDALRVVRNGMTIEAGGEMRPLGRDGAVRMQIGWSGLTEDLLPVEDFPPELSGRLDGNLSVRGAVAAPEIEGRMLWLPSHAESPLGEIAVRLFTRDGEAVLVSDSFATRGGPAVLFGRVPLGGVPRPEWMWTDAPAGVARLGLEAPALDLTPLLAALGFAAPGVTIRTGVDIEARVDLLAPANREVDAVLAGLELRSETENLRALEPVRLELRDGTLSIVSAEMRGPNSFLRLGGSVDLDEQVLDVEARAAIDSRLLQLVAPMLLFEGPVWVEANARGAFDAPVGRIRIDHRGGSIAMRDPPLQIRDLQLGATLGGGSISIEEGSATVNRGTVNVAGGWDPDLEQGIVFELDDVAFVLEQGIVTRWDGLVALEPRARGRFAVVGDVILDRGLWDSDVDFTSMLLAQLSSAAPPDVPSATEQILLDLEVTAREGLEIDNNLGQLELHWQRLYVRGTAARPIIEGQIRVMPNGLLLLGGRPVEVTRGLIEFSGDPGEAPRVEIITQAPADAIGEGEAPTTTSRRISLADLAQVNVLKAVGGVFGLSNTRIEPMTIAAETDSNPGTNLSVARVLGDNLVLFLTTDLTNTQERTTLLQAWNFNGLPGFAVQAFSSTTDGDGAAVLERIRFGGSRPPGDEGPFLRRVRIEGDWPISKRRARRATGLRRGQQYDPFLAFVGEVRLERALAEAGYYLADVTGVEAGDEDEPHLVFRVEAGPRVDIRFTGDRLPRDVRRRVAALYRPEPLVEESIEAMRTALARELLARGYPFAGIESERDARGVVISVARGTKLEMAGLTLEGVPDQVRREIEPLMASPVVLAELARSDEESLARLRGLLLREGYPDVEIAEVTLERDGAEAHVRVVVEAGERLRLERILAAGPDPLAVLARQDFPLKAGMPLRFATVEAAARWARQLYREAGYPDADVRTAVVEGQTPAWDVRVHLDPGERRVVSGVEIRGLRHIKESTIRAGLELDEGDPVRVSALDETATNLATFAPIDRIQVQREDRGGGRSLLRIDLEEKPRWLVGGGVRWRSETGEELLFDLRDDNLLGRGVGLNFRGHWGSQSKAARLYGSLPPLPGGRLAFNAWFSFSEREVGDITEREQSFTLEGRLRRSPTTELRAYLRRERERRFERDMPPPFGFDVVVTSGAVGGQLVIDRRDDPFNPTRGWYGGVDVSYTPRFLDSDFQVLRSLVTTSIASTHGRRWTLGQGLRLGYARSFDGFMPFLRSARFFAGGETTLRGFDRDTVGPRDLLGGEIQPVGGGALAIVNEELRFALFERVLLAAFVDAGQVWPRWSEADWDLSVGAGLGVRLLTPLGPARVDVGFPISNKQGNRGARYYFGIGQVF